MVFHRLQCVDFSSSCAEKARSLDELHVLRYAKIESLVYIAQKRYLSGREGFSRWYDRSCEWLAEFPVRHVEPAVLLDVDSDQRLWTYGDVKSTGKSISPELEACKSRKVGSKKRWKANQNVLERRFQFFGVCTIKRRASYSFWALVMSLLFFCHAKLYRFARVPSRCACKTGRSDPKSRHAINIVFPIRQSLFFCRSGTSVEVLLARAPRQLHGKWN